MQHPPPCTSHALALASRVMRLPSSVCRKPIIIIYRALDRLKSTYNNTNACKNDQPLNWGASCMICMICSKGSRRIELCRNSLVLHCCAEFKMFCSFRIRCPFAQQCGPSQHSSPLCDSKLSQTHGFIIGTLTIKRLSCYPCLKKVFWVPEQSLCSHDW